MAHVIGMDPSLTGFAAVRLNGSEVACQRWTSAPSEFVDRIARMAWLTGEVQRWAFKPPLSAGLQHPDLVVVEGYAYGSTHGRELLGELGGMLRWDLYGRGRFLEVPPTVLKKWVTGKGVAAKDVMMMTVFKRWGFESVDNNVADAYALAKLGEAWLANEVSPAVGFDRDVAAKCTLFDPCAITPVKQPGTKRNTRNQNGR